MLVQLLKTLDDRELAVTQGSPFHFERGQEIKPGIKGKGRMPLHGGGGKALGTTGARGPFWLTCT